MRVLALDAALGRCSAALVTDGRVDALRQADGARGHAAQLPVMVADVLAGGPPPELVAVTVGPGSFTGIRAALALAHGIALGAGCPVVGVSVGEALAQAWSPASPRALWAAVDTKRGRVALERAGLIEVFGLDDLPMPDRPVAIAGDAACVVAAGLAARGADVALTDLRLPQAECVAAVAVLRHAGRLPPRPAQPLYAEAPEARPPVGGLRPAPA